MNFLEIALHNALHGFPIFPAQSNKTPMSGFKDWENNASTDMDQIKEWWEFDPEFLPAVTPGRVGTAVIDVDRHEGGEDGFSSIVRSGAKDSINRSFQGLSLSRKGVHCWFVGDIGSVNGILPGVDRKARGGYVIAPYKLPPLLEIHEPLPEVLSGSPASVNVERKYKTISELQGWLHTAGVGEPDAEMNILLYDFDPTAGNSHMSSHVARVVSKAANGHPGAHTILERMQDEWIKAPHKSGDPEEEFMINVRSAIEKFGEAAEKQSLIDAMKNNLKARFTL